MSTDSRSGDLRKALGQFPTGVTIVTTVRNDGTPVGLTVNSFNSLSLEPPMVLWSINSKSPSLEYFIRNGKFAICILSERHEELSRRFGKYSGQDKFDSVEFSMTESGLPVVRGVIAYFECDVDRAMSMGDHHLMIGRVRNFDFSDSGRPLVYFRGNYASVD